MLDKMIYFYKYTINICLNPSNVKSYFKCKFYLRSFYIHKQRCLTLSKKDNAVKRVILNYCLQILCDPFVYKC